MSIEQRGCTTYLEHDPDGGCNTCPLLRSWGDPGEPTRWCMGGECDAALTGEPAPRWCPLRCGPVVVRKPLA